MSARDKLLALETACNNERDTAMIAARRDIDAKLDAKYGDLLRAAKAEYQAEVSAAQDAAIAQGKAKLAAMNGQVLVEEWDYKRYGRFSRSDTRQRTGRKGRIEVVEPATRFPGNVRWSLPKVGYLFVRIQSKGGSYGLAFDRYDPERWRQITPPTQHSPITETQRKNLDATCC